jgi:hypothetical protein
MMKGFQQVLKSLYFLYALYLLNAFSIQKSMYIRNICHRFKAIFQVNLFDSLVDWENHFECFLEVFLYPPEIVYKSA